MLVKFINVLVYFFRRGGWWWRRWWRGRRRRGGRSLNNFSKDTIPGPNESTALTRNEPTKRTSQREPTDCGCLFFSLYHIVRVRKYECRERKTYRDLVSCLWPKFLVISYFYYNIRQVMVVISFISSYCLVYHLLIDIATCFRWSDASCSVKWLDLVSQPVVFSWTEGGTHLFIFLHLFIR